MYCNRWQKVVSLLFMSCRRNFLRLWTACGQAQLPVKKRPSEPVTTFFKAQLVINFLEALLYCTHCTIDTGRHDAQVTFDVVVQIMKLHELQIRKC